MIGLIYEAIERRCLREPDRVALVAKGERWSYGQLAEDSSRLAHALQDLGVRRGDRVALLMRKGGRFVCAMLAVQKAGAAYVPLDQDSPPARLATMIRSAAPAVVFVDGGAAAVLQDVWLLLRDEARPQVVWVDRPPPPPSPWVVALTWDQLPSFAATAPPCEARDHDLLYLMYTSGSTGEPKGVGITHANVRAFVTWACHYFGMGPGDRVSMHAPMHFDLSTFDVYGTLAVGATLYPVPPEAGRLPTQLAEFMRETRLTQWFSAPSVLTYMCRFDVVREGDFPTLKRLLWCGEVMPTHTLIYLMRRLPHVRFTNLYGPTETAVASSVYPVPGCPSDERQAIPIGLPCAGERLVVLDDGLQPCPPGVSGELCIGGVGVGPGYWRDEARTRTAFIADPAHPGERLYRTGDMGRLGTDGLYYFEGRRDSQIKSRGYRIELGEVEAALHADPAVSECAVVAVNANGLGTHMICCAWVGADASADEAAIAARLGARVPRYMLPAKWRRLPQLPLNANGKLDRPAVTAMFGAG